MSNTSDYELIEPENQGTNLTRLNMSHNIGDSQEIIVTITPPEDGNKTNLRIVCLLDRSTSMISPITSQTEDGTIEDDNLTRMDLAIHTCRTIIETLPVTSELAIISFNNKVKQHMPLTPMSEEAKKKAFEHIDKLNPHGMTNLWDPLENAFNLFLENPNSKTNDVIIMLTDGEPTTRPIRGEIAEMKLYMEERFHSQKINPPTFIPIGFTNAQDSVLLNQMASQTNEMQYYISDASMMGTVFVNVLSYIRSVVNRNAVLTLTSYTNDVTFDSSLRETYTNIKYETHKVVIPVGSIGYGQSRHIVVPYLYKDSDTPTPKKDIQFTAELTYRTNEDNYITTDFFYDMEPKIILNQLIRMNFAFIIRLILKNMHDPDKCKQILIEGLTQLRKYNDDNDEYLSNLDADYLESIKAIDPEYINSWGKHYINALGKAHEMERCSNFRDKGVQNYGSNVFRTYQMEGEKIFKDIDIEKHVFRDESPNSPFNNTNLLLGNRVAGVPKLPHIKKHTLVGVQHKYINVRGGCFTGDSKITMGNGLKKKIKYVKKGDIVKTSQGTSVVEVVVRFKCKDNLGKMVKYSDDLIISPYHPIFDEFKNKWIFPVDYKNYEMVESKYVYDFVLKRHHTIYVGNILACTFGHGIKGDVIEHQYFGTQQIINDLKKVKGYKEGKINLPDNCFLRAVSDAPITALDWDNSYC